MAPYPTKDYDQWWKATERQEKYQPWTIHGYRNYGSSSGDLAAGLTIFILLLLVVFITWICCCCNRRCRRFGMDFLHCCYGCFCFRFDCASQLDLKTAIKRYLEYPPLKKDDIMEDTCENPYISKILLYLAISLPEFFFSILPTGSLREGYGKLQPSTSVLATDYDLMLVPDGVTAGDPSSGASVDPTLLVTENEKIPKGFIWLSLNYLELKHWKNISIPRHVKNYVGHYLSINKMLQVLKRHISAIAFTEVEKKAEKTSVSINGPAITVKVQKKKTTPEKCVDCCCICCSGQERELTLFYCDFTIGIHHPQWPKRAANWFSTERRKHWPPPIVVDRIRNRGCHVVPKASVKGKLLKYKSAQPTLTAFDQAPDLEWRYSFSQPEIELSDCLPDVAKEALLALKAINKAHLQSKEDSVPNISSYVLKSILLREVENRNMEEWTQLGADDVLYELLEKLHQALMSGKCSHYWIDDINLLEDMPRERLTELADKVMEIRENPCKFTADNWLELNRFLRLYCCLCGSPNGNPGKGDCCTWKGVRYLWPCSYGDAEWRNLCRCPYDEINYDVY